MPRKGGTSLILGIGLLAAAATVATAQQPSVTKITQSGQSMTSTSSRVVHVVIDSVNGNKVVAEDAAGKATEYTIPDGFKFQLDGKDIGVADLKPGQHVTATITTTTTTTPVYVTTIKSGKVLVVSGQSIIVRGPHGNQVFSNQDAVKRNATIMKNGQKVIDQRPARRRHLHRHDRHGRSAEGRLRARGRGHGPRGARGCPRLRPVRLRRCRRRPPPPHPPKLGPPLRPRKPRPPRRPPPPPRILRPLPRPRPLLRPRSPRRQVGFPTWLILLILLIVIIIIVMFTRRRKSS